MQFLKDIDLKKPLHLFKVAVLGLFGVVAVVFVLSLINSSVRPFLTPHTGESVSSVAPSFYGSARMGEIAMDSSKGMPIADLSYRNTALMQSQTTIGNTAEDFEVTDYSAVIETGNKAEVCSQIANLKSLKHVIFENAQESDRNCAYTFKVEHVRAGEILAVIKDFDPKDLSENTRTIKSQIDDFTSQTEILEKKRASIDETLKNALTAYDQITALAVKTQDASSLAKIIDSKVQLIERMTQERININQQLDYLARAKTEQMDRLEYTYFSVSVYENKYIDGKNLKDSWQAAVKNFVFTINRALQDASINLIGLLFTLIPYFIYALIVLFAAKYGWRLVVYIWKK
ncbi:MAG: hypothetical protein KBC69_01260 [Candidatus Magasanikbacteria bacterium]|nr:hypothetical protein [Candidatus Magasanikbacteria bacterium]